MWIPLSISAPHPPALIHILLWPICAAQLPACSIFFLISLSLQASKTDTAFYLIRGWRMFAPNDPRDAFHLPSLQIILYVNLEEQNIAALSLGWGNRTLNTFFHLGPRKMGDLYEEAEIFWSWSCRNWFSVQLVTRGVMHDMSVITRLDLQICSRWLFLLVTLL